MATSRAPANYSSKPSQFFAALATNTISRACWAISPTSSQRKAIRSRQRKCTRNPTRLSATSAFRKTPPSNWLAFPKRSPAWADLEEGKKRGLEALEIARSIGSKDTASLALNNVATAQFQLGDLPATKRTLEDGIALTREINSQRILAYFLGSMGELLLAEGDLPGARKNQEEALKIRTALGGKGDISYSDWELAILAIEEGHPEGAEKGARDSAKEFHDENSPDAEANSWVVLSRALLAENKINDARAPLENARAAVKKSQTPETHIVVDIIVARIQAATGQPADQAQAIAALEATLLEATKYHMLIHQFEARLAIGEIEIKSGKSAAGRARLAALEKEASAKGCLLIARKAAKAAK